MLLFLLVFLSFYGGLHLYGYWRFKAAFTFDPSIGIPIMAFLAIMICAPIIVHFLENSGGRNVARIMAYFGYTWMAFIFLFFAVGLTFDVYHFFLRLGSWIMPRDLTSLAITVRWHFFIPFFLASLAVLYGFYEVAHIRTERLTVFTPHFPVSVGSLKIAQISDMHLGLIAGPKRLKKILEIVAGENPDVLVSTGDLVDGEICQNGELTGVLQSYNPRLGKYAVTGNHEYYAGIDRAVHCTQEGGFKMLRGQAVDVNGMIYLVGVDDPTGRSFGEKSQLSEKELLSDLPGSNSDRQGRKFVLLLKHQPVVDRGSVGLFDLQLSGHTHKGQIFPFSLVTQLSFIIDNGLMTLGNGSHLYVSRGTGTWGPPIRFLAPPEITIIEIVHSDKQQEIIFGHPTIVLK